MKTTWCATARGTAGVRFAIAIASLVLCFLAGSPAAFAQSYESLTAAALDKLVASADQLDAGNLEGARATLASIDASVLTLDTQIKNYRDLANRERLRCVDRVGELDRRIGEILTEQEKLDNQIKALDADLAQASADQQLSQQEITRLTEKMRQVEAAFRDRQARLEELTRWWWVPGYGQYLAIRTLVDDDIGQERSLANTLNDEARRFHSAQLAMQAAQNTRTHLSAERARIAETARALPGMKDEAVKRNKEIRATTLFLSDAEVYWGKLQSILQNRVGASQADLALMRDLLAKETYPPLQAEYSDQMVTMKKAVLAFAQAVDTKRDFALNESTDFCGGPPLSQVAAARTPPQRCNISSITQYYEIVDPTTCAFRYLNPPGCPPAPQAIAVDTQGVAAGTTRGAWMQVEGQNWVGRKRCDSADAIYYGKKNSIQECENTCKADARCRFWTYNRNNGVMPNAIQECWGAKSTIEPTKVNWGGYISGGY